MQIVSLTTDFGIRDYHVAELKVALLKSNATLNILDVSHDVDSYDIVEAAYNVDNIYRNFPEGSIHIISVYNYYDKHSEYVAYSHEGQFFIAPNNGVLTLLFQGIRTSDLYLIDREGMELKNLPQIFAHAVGYLSHGLPIAELGGHPESTNERMSIQPVVTSNQIRATIIHIDHFGNVVVNLKKDKFDEIRAGRQFEIYYQQSDPVTYLSKDYGEVPIGEVLALFNSAEYMEIAINVGKASELLSLKKNETIQINFFG